MDDELALLACVAGILIASHENIKNKRRKRQVWSRTWLQRRNEGRGLLSMVKNELMVGDPEAFTNFLRMDITMFEKLLKMVRPIIEKKDTVMRESIPADMRLAVTLRFLATGETYRNLMYSTRIHETTLSKFVPEVLEAIYDVLKDTYLKVPNTSQEWKKFSSQFEVMWQMPNCIGAMDGKHIGFRALKEHGSMFFNYKGFHSIVLLAVVDAQYKFTYIDIGASGRTNDGRVYAESSLARALQRNSLDIPNDKELPGRDMKVPYMIVADSAFPLTERILKPYPQRDLTYSRRVCNYRLSRARRTSENAFGILVNRFRILLNIIDLSAFKVELIVQAACALHNFLITHNRQQYADLANTEIATLTPVLQQGGNRTGNRAATIRNEFEEYFNSQQGSVPWQDDAIRNNQA